MGIRRQRRREAEPRREQARMRAIAWGAAQPAERRVLRRWREMAWAKTVCEWRWARRWMLAMEGELVEGSKRSEWTVVKRAVS